MRYKRSSTPAYLIWIDKRPSLTGKGKAAYVQAVKTAASLEIREPIVTEDIEVDIVYCTRVIRGHRIDTDNIIKPTLDALKGIAFPDDSYVRDVSSRLFDRNDSNWVEGRVENMGRLFYSREPHVVLISIYSDSRLSELGGEEKVERQRFEMWQRRTRET